VAGHCKIHQAAAVQRWLQPHPIERCFGDLHDKVTRNHRRKRMRDLVRDVQQHLAQNGPWHYQLSEVYQAAEVTETLEKQVALSSSAVA
jgi:hypothetical protein